MVLGAAAVVAMVMPVVFGEMRLQLSSSMLDPAKPLERMLTTATTDEVTAAIQRGTEKKVHVAAGIRAELRAQTAVAATAKPAAPLQGAGAGVSVLHGTGPLPSYEVATIKPALGGGPSQTVRTYIKGAYRLFNGADDRVLGGPSWIDTNHYVIQGKIPEDMVKAREKMTAEERVINRDLMMQALLADRFKLKVHFETREMPVYEMVVAKGGPKLGPPTPPAPGEPLRTNLGVRLQAGNVISGDAEPVSAISTWLMLLPEIGGRPVIDKTGLKGLYSFQIRGYRALPPGAPSVDQPPIFSFLEEQLGLKLVSAKGPVEVIVIDHLELPTEN